VLVNNAGVGAPPPLLDANVDRLEAMIDLNVTALVRLTYATLPGFLNRGGGAIEKESYHSCLFRNEVYGRPTKI
jgi:hypothetical protein